MTNLYPDYIRTFANIHEAITYAQEIEGYHELWRAIFWAKQIGLIGVN